MNTGAISSRYAKALLAYVTETGRGEQLCREVSDLVFNEAGELPDKVSPELESFIALLRRNGRLDCLKMVLVTFVGMYYRQAGIKHARLYSVKPDKALEEKVRAMLAKQTGCRIELESFVDADLIGGFVLKVDDYIMDASVKHQIDALRREFNTDNSRIVLWRRIQ